MNIETNNKKSQLSTPQPITQQNSNKEISGPERAKDLPPMPDKTNKNLVSVDSVEVVKVEKNQGRAEVIVAGMLPDACTEINEVTTDREGTTFTIILEATRPPDSMCAQVLTPFEEQVNINISDVAEGMYSVDVNGMTTMFEIK
ncbi:MAG: hypothetical protein ACOX6V_04500 [Patescibacteria group bacterium]|jgi:hypothetical protein